jgi:hypothetical protein
MSAIINQSNGAGKPSTGRAEVGDADQHAQLIEESLKKAKSRLDAMMAQLCPLQQQADAMMAEIGPLEQEVDRLERALHALRVPAAAKSVGPSRRGKAIIPWTKLVLENPWRTAAAYARQAGVAKGKAESRLNYGAQVGRIARQMDTRQGQWIYGPRSPATATST